MYILVTGACLALTILYVLWADVAPGWKLFVILLYVATWFVGRLLQISLPIGFIVQAALCIYYLIYFKFKGM